LPEKEAGKGPNLFNCGALSCTPISDEEFSRGVQPIFNMCGSKIYEARLEGSKMLCDLFQQGPSQLQLPPVARACIESVEKLLCDGFDDIKQHSVMAASLLSEIYCFKSELIRSEVLMKVVVNMVVENSAPHVSYETISTRRECAKILITLALSDAQGVMDSITRIFGCPLLESEWYNKVNVLDDKRLKSQSLKVVEHLRTVA
jgi:hypothetical protein